MNVYGCLNFARRGLFLRFYAGGRCGYRQSVEKRLNSQKISIGQQEGIFIPDDGVCMVPDDRGRRDDVAAIGLEVYARPFAALDTLAGRDMEIQMQTAAGADGARCGQIGQRLLEVREQIRLIEVEDDETGDRAGDDGQAGVSLRDKPALELVGRGLAALIRGPGDRGDFGLDRDDAVAVRPEVQGRFVWGWRKIRISGARQTLILLAGSWLVSARNMRYAKGAKRIFQGRSINRVPAVLRGPSTSLPAQRRLNFFIG
jgi:hypothetical protein